MKSTLRPTKIQRILRGEADAHRSERLREWLSASFMTAAPASTASDEWLPTEFSRASSCDAWARCYAATRDADRALAVFYRCLDKAGEELSLLMPIEKHLRHRESELNRIVGSSDGALLPQLSALIEAAYQSAMDEAVLRGAEIASRLKERRLNRRHEQIVSLAGQLPKLTIRDVLGLFPDVPRRTLERDLEILTRNRQLVAVGEKKGRIYTLGALTPSYGKEESPSSRGP